MNTPPEGVSRETYALCALARVDWGFRQAVLQWWKDGEYWVDPGVGGVDGRVVVKTCTAWFNLFWYLSLLGWRTPLSRQLQAAMVRMPDSPSSEALDPRPIVHRYQGSDPIIGFGTEVSRWSFTINTAHLSGKNAVAFAADALNGLSNALSKGVESLGDIRRSGSSIFVHESVPRLSQASPYLQKEKWPLEESTWAFLPNRVSVALHDALRRGMVEHSAAPWTWYDWSAFNIGETSALLTALWTLRLRGGLLFIEVHHRLLPSLPDPDVLLQRAHRMWPVHMSEEMVRLAAWPFWGVLQPVAEGIWRWMTRGPHRGGVSCSLREIAMPYDTHAFYAHPDVEMHVRMTDRKILDTLRQFLDENGVDTSDLREQQAMVLRNSVVVTGNHNLIRGNRLGDRIRRWRARASKKASA